MSWSLLILQSHPTSSFLQSRFTMTLWSLSTRSDTLTCPGLFWLSNPTPHQPSPIPELQWPHSPYLQDPISSPPPNSSHFVITPHITLLPVQSYNGPTVFIYKIWHPHLSRSLNFVHFSLPSVQSYNDPAAFIHRIWYSHMSWSLLILQSHPTSSFLQSRFTMTLWSLSTKSDTLTCPGLFWLSNTTPHQPSPIPELQWPHSPYLQDPISSPPPNSSHFVITPHITLLPVQSYNGPTVFIYKIWYPHLSRSLLTSLVSHPTPPLL